MIIVIAGHYGVGKTNLALNVALDYTRAGWEVVVADVDVVNPYFRSSDYTELLEAEGVRVIAPLFAHTSLDNPSLSSEIAAAIEWAGGLDFESGSETASGFDFDGGSDAGTRRDTEAGLDMGGAHGSARPTDRILVIDVGGDDAGATAIGRFSETLSRFPYELIYVVNKYRNLTQEPEEALEILREIERKSHLRATAIVNNSHLRDETTVETIEAARAFGEECARRAGLPLLATVVPEALADELLEHGSGVAAANASAFLPESLAADSNDASVPAFALLLEDATSGQREGSNASRNLYPVKKLVTTPWE